MTRKDVYDELYIDSLIITPPIGYDCDNVEIISQNDLYNLKKIYFEEENVKRYENVCS